MLALAMPPRIPAFTVGMASRIGVRRDYERRLSLGNVLLAGIPPVIVIDDENADELVRVGPVRSHTGRISGRGQR